MAGQITDGKLEQEENKTDICPNTELKKLSTEELVNNIHESAEDFVKGEKAVLTWNIKKEDIIKQIAFSMAALMDREHYSDHKDPHEISQMVCDILRDHQFIDENAYRHVRRILSPYGFTRKYSILYDVDEEKRKKLFTYASKEEIQDMSLDELLTYNRNVLTVDQERKRQIRLTKDNINKEFENRDIDPKTYSPKKNLFDPNYTEANAEDDEIEPPAELKENHLFKDKFSEGTRYVAKLYKIFMGIEEHIDLFPPQNAELDKRLASFQDTTNKNLLAMLVKFYSGYNDDKAVSSFDGWFDYLEEKALHGNNAAASKYEQRTGEYLEQTRKDGKKFIKALARRVTNEHLKKRMPEQVKEIKNFWLFSEIFGALRTWGQEQYYVVGGNDKDNAEIEQEYVTNSK